MRARGHVWFLLGFVVLWIVANSSLVLNPNLFLPRDSFYFHYQAFDYVARYLRDAGQFPEWDFASILGVPLAPGANSYLLLMPHRWVGYSLVAVLGVPAAAAYKFSFLFVGQGLFLLGLALYVRARTQSVWLASAAICVWLVTGGGLGLFHQEQVLGTLGFVPWLWWLAPHAARDGRSQLLFASLLGASLNFHHPQLFVAYCLVVAVLCRPRLSGIPWKRIALAVVCFLVSASPALWTYVCFRGEIVSPYREQDAGIFSQSYAEYEKLNRISHSSLDPQNTTLLLLPTVDPSPRREMGYLDEASLFWGLGVLFWAAPFLLWARRKREMRRASDLGVAAVLLVLAWGVHGPAAKLFFETVPGFSAFRQWYHFLPLVNFHLVVALVVFAAMLPRKGAAFLLAVVVLGALPGARRVWHKLEASQLVLAPERREFRRPNLYVPRGVRPAEISRDYPIGAFHWVGETGKRLREVLPHEVTVRWVAGGARVELVQAPPVGAQQLVWLQSNDGSWNRDERSTSSLLTMSLAQGVRSWQWRRAPTLWQILVLLMWAPTLVVIASAAKQSRGMKLPATGLLRASPSQ